MGWLYELAKRQGKTKKGALAREVYEHAGWDGPTLEHKRSPENFLLALDKGDLAKLEQHRDWLPDVLADVLDVPVSEIWDEAERARREREGGSTLLWLPDLGRAEPLDLSKDDLFPGLPSMVLTPQKWTTHWWTARRSEEVEVVAAFLRARLLAKVVRAASWAEALEKLPARGAAFVIMTNEAGAASARQEDLPKRIGVCVAASARHPKRPLTAEERRMSRTRRLQMRRLASQLASLPDQGWNTIQNPSLETWLEPLLRWVLNRLDAQGHFDFDRAHRLARRFPEHAFRGPCDLLSFCGVLDDLRPTLADKQDPAAFLRTWLRHSTGRIQTLDPTLEAFFEDPARGLHLVRGMVRNLLVERGASDVAPTAEEWARLAPAELILPPDIEGARALLPNAGEALEGEALDKMRAKLGPSPRALVDTLVELRVLRRKVDDRYDFDQTWLLLLLFGDVLEALPDESPRALGKALLRYDADGVLLQLCKRLAGGDTGPLARAIDALDETDVFSVAAFEGCLRAYGLAVLMGLEPDRALANRALELQTRLFVPLYEGQLPEPTIALERGRDRGAWSKDGAWYLALMALAERLEDPTLPSPALNPWASTEPHPVLHRLMSAGYAAAWHGEEQPPWALGAFDLGRRLWERGLRCHRHGIATHGVEELMVPGAVVASLRREERPPEDLSYFDARGHSRWAILRDQAKRQRVGYRALLAALWNAWALLPVNEREIPRIPPHNATDLQIREIEELWRAAPPALFGGPLFEAVEGGTGVPRQVLGRDQWRAWLDAYDQNRHSLRTVIDAMPEDLLIACFRKGMLEGPKHRDERKTLWRRLPELLRQETIASLDGAPLDTKSKLLWSIPDGLWPSMFEEVASWATKAERTAEERLLIARLMHRHVGARLPGWERAYELYAEMVEGVRT